MNNANYQCPVCGLHYIEEAIAKDCESFCREFKGCSLDISRHSIEHRAYVEKQQKDSDENIR